MNYGYIRVSTKAQLDNNSFEQQEKEILKRYFDAEIHKKYLRVHVLINQYLISYWIN